MNTVIGVRPVSFKDKVNPDKVVEGVSIYYTYPLTHGDGCGADKAFLSSYMLDKMGGEVPAVGAKIEFVYNKYGKIAGINYCK